MRLYVLLFVLSLGSMKCTEPTAAPASSITASGPDIKAECQVFIENLIDIVRKNDESRMFDQFIHDKAELKTLIQSDPSGRKRPDIEVESKANNMSVTILADKGRMISKFTEEKPFFADWTKIVLDSISVEDQMLPTDALQFLAVHGYFSSSEQPNQLLFAVVRFKDGRLRLVDYPRKGF